MGTIVARISPFEECTMTWQLLSGGHILPLHDATTSHEALVIDDAGRVAGVGSHTDMSVLAGDAADAVDLDGATVIPGLIDTHPHVLHFGARERAVLDITDCQNHDEIVERIRQRAATTPSSEWIVTTPVGEPHYFVRRSYRDLDRHDRSQQLGGPGNYRSGPIELYPR